MENVLSGTNLPECDFPARRGGGGLSVLDTVDELIGSVPWGQSRMVLVYRRQHGGRAYVRLRTFNRHRVTGFWYPSPRFFVIPLDCAFELAKAIEAAAKGEPIGSEPEWYAGFEKQYRTTKRRETSASRPRFSPLASY